MSVVNMKKLTVFVHRSQVDELVKRIIRLRCVEISECAPDTDFERFDLEKERNELESIVDDIERAIAVIGKISKRSKGTSKEKISADLDSFEAEGFADRALFIALEALASAERREKIEGELKRIATQLEAIIPYSNLDIPLGTVGTRSTNLVIGSLPSDTDIDGFGRTLYGKGAIIDLISESAKGKFVSVLWHNSDAAEVSEVLSSFGFVRADFSGVDKIPAEYKVQLEADREKLMQELYAIDEKFFALSQNQSSLKICYDIKRTALNEVIAKQKFVSIGSTVMMLGWVPTKKEGAVSELLEKYDCAYSLEAPTEEDRPPILLMCGELAESFGWIPNLCSRFSHSRTVFSPDCSSSKYTKIKNR